MINLLPEIHKNELGAARTNRLLMRYLIVLVGFVVLIAIFAGLVFVYLTTTKASAETSLADNTADSAQLSQEKLDIEEFKTNLQVAKQVLDKKIDYSGLVLKYAAAIPSGSIISTISLDPTITTAASTITAESKSEAAALQLKSQLQASPYFDDVHFQSLTFVDGNDYPYQSILAVKVTQELFDE